MSLPTHVQHMKPLSEMHVEQLLRFPWSFLPKTEKRAVTPQR